jgi:uncharacterized cupredoxin-like copper-binding protein
MKYTRVSIAALTIVTVLALAGCGQDKSTSTGASGRVVDVTMTDNAFAPGNLQVTKGETVTFRFHNKGAAVHEAVIGDNAMQAEHHEKMTNATAPGNTMMGSTMTTMAMGHGGMDSDAGESDETIVQPGQMAEMKHTFTESGNLLIGCHEPGHWEAGMKASVTVQ